MQACRAHDTCRRVLTVLVGGTASQTLDHAVANNAANCQRLVDAGGLKYLFPAFMGKGAAKTAKLHGASEVKAVEEHVVAILASMLTWLPEDSVARCVRGWCAPAPCRWDDDRRAHVTMRPITGSECWASSLLGTWTRPTGQWSSSSSTCSW